MLSGIQRIYGKYHGEVDVKMITAIEIGLAVSALIGLLSYLFVEIGCGEDNRVLLSIVFAGVSFVLVILIVSAISPLMQIQTATTLVVSGETIGAGGFGYITDPCGNVYEATIPVYFQIRVNQTYGVIESSNDPFWTYVVGYPMIEKITSFPSDQRQSGRCSGNT